MECRGLINSGPKKGKVCRRKLKNKETELCGYHKSKHKVVVTEPKNKKVTSKSKENKVIKNKLDTVDSICVICLENNSSSGSLVLGCKHRFHYICIVQIDGNCCPMCRAKIIGVPLYIRIILKKNYDNNNKIKELEEEINIHHHFGNHDHQGHIMVFNAPMTMADLLETIINDTHY